MLHKLAAIGRGFGCGTAHIRHVSLGGWSTWWRVSAFRRTTLHFATLQASHSSNISSSTLDKMLSTITRLGSLKAHTLAVQATKNGVAATALRTFAVAGSGHPIHPMIRQVLHIIPPERIQDTEKLEVAMEGGW